MRCCTEVMFPGRMVERASDFGRPSIEGRATMGEYIGLDVSLKDTAVSIRRDGKRIWRGKCAPILRRWQY